MQTVIPKPLSHHSTYLTQPGTQTVVRDSKGYGVKVPSRLSMIASIGWHLGEAMGMSGGGFAIYGMVKSAYAASAMAMHNWMLESDGREPLKPGSPEYIATEAVYQGLGDLVGSQVAGAAHGVFGALSPALRPLVNRGVQWLTTPSGMSDEEAEPHVNRHFILTVTNPSLRVPLDHLVSFGFGLNTVSSSYRTGTGEVDPSVVPGKAPAEGTYAPFDTDSPAVRNAGVGFMAMALGLMYVKFTDGQLRWGPPPPATMASTALTMSSRVRAGYEMSTSGVLGSKVPVWTVQGAISALLATMKVNGAGELSLAIANSALNGLLHLQRVHHWGHARRESELVGNYGPIIAQARGDGQRDSLVRESKLADSLREAQFEPDPWMQEAMKATLPVLGSFLAGVAAQGIMNEPHGMTSPSDWSVHGGPFSSINIEEALTGMAVGLVFNQLAGQLLPEPIPVPAPQGPAVAAGPEDPARASKARKDLVAFTGALSGGAVAGFSGGPGMVLGSAIIALTHRVSVLPKNPAHSLMAHVKSLAQSISALWRPGEPPVPQGSFRPAAHVPPEPAGLPEAGGPQIEVLDEPAAIVHEHENGDEAVGLAVAHRAQPATVVAEPPPLAGTPEAPHPAAAAQPEPAAFPRHAPVLTETPPQREPLAVGHGDDDGPVFIHTSPRPNRHEFTSGSRPPQGSVARQLFTEETTPLKHDDGKHARRNLSEITKPG